MITFYPNVILQIHLPKIFKDYTSLPLTLQIHLLPSHSPFHPILCFTPPITLTSFISPSYPQFSLMLICILTFLSAKCFPPKSREYSICPIISRGIQSSKHLWGCNCLRIHPHFTMWYSTFTHRFHQRVNTGCLASTTWPQDHHTVTHPLSLEQLLQEREGRYYNGAID